VTRAIAGIAALGVLLSFQLSNARVVSSACGPGTASAARTTTASPAPVAPGPCPGASSQQVNVYDQLRARLSADLARALTTQQQLSAALDRTAASEQRLTDQITAEEDRIATLEDEVAQLDSQIQDTQDRIDVERGQVGAVARAAYRQPKSLFEVIARAGSLREALVSTVDLVVAGQRAHSLQTRLEADVTKLQAERDARLSDIDRENGLRDQLYTNMGLLNDLMATQDDISVRLDDLISQFQDAESQVQGQAPDVTQALAVLLEQEEQQIIQETAQAAWDQAQLGAGLAQALHLLPAGTNVSGVVLSWPMIGAHITQPFGPTSLVLEPSLGPYPHFHTGIDLAAPLGTTVMSAADGIVVAVAHTHVGYGYYVMVAHGSGVVTLYAHLLETDVNVGDRVTRGKRIGLEGSTGLSTGPHVHFEVRINNQVVDPMRFLLPNHP
jgi:murein DD-endopeptidase MepM/ murein hydrolase activator NlpD